MRRTEIVRALRNILHNLKTTDVNAPIENVIHENLQGEDLFNQSLLVKLNQYSLIAKDYGTTEHKIAKILGLSDLSNPEKWAELIYTKHAGAEALNTISQNIRFSLDYIPSLLELLEPEYLPLIDKPSGELPHELKDKAILTTILIEDEAHPATPERLAQLLLSISTLYDASTEILSHPSVPLTIVGCDSGSEKSFDFLGADRVIQMVKEIILSLWDRVVFFRERQMSQRLELVAQSLPVLEQIVELKNDKTISREQAELLRRRVLESIQKFINCGAVTPEMQERSTFNPYELMMPETKLLNEGASNNPDNG